MTHVTALATLSVGNVTIHQKNGLYSLNDLHKASGGESKHQPALFVRLDTTRALIAELSKSTDMQNYRAAETVRGKFGGTYACRELVIAYAAWISAEFQLKVIRVFLDTAAPAAQPALPLPAPASQTEQAITEIVQDAAQRIHTALQQHPPQVQWREVIRAVKQATVAITFPELTDLATACLKRLQQQIGHEAYSAISHRAAEQGVSTLHVPLNA